VHRRCAIDTTSAPSIYGNAFSRASEQLVRARVAVIPAHPANLYAFEAPPSGSGLYTLKQIRGVLATAYAAFRAVVAMPPCSGGEQCEQAAEAQPELELHIGYWGCGAYGGCRVLMVLLQLLAARLAGIPHVLMHAAPGGDDSRDAQAAIELAAHAPLHDCGDLDELLAWACDKGFEWGESDGN
jgi:hypothetical protein